MVAMAVEVALPAVVQVDLAVLLEHQSALVPGRSRLRPRPHMLTNSKQTHWPAHKEGWHAYV